MDLVVITVSYKPLRTNQWASDATGKAAIWYCGELLFQDNIDSIKKGFVRAKLGNDHFYSCYAPPSLEMEEFTDLNDSLDEDVRERSPVVIAGVFNARPTNWSSKWTNRRGNELLDTSIVDLTIASARGSKVSMFDPELFRTVLATKPMNANNAIEEAEELMERIVDAYDATIPRKSTCNWHPLVH